MRLSQLRTHWTADDAHLILSFLDELKDVVWATYGAEIIEQQRKNQTTTDQSDPQLGLDIDSVDNF